MKNERASGAQRHCCENRLAQCAASRGEVDVHEQLAVPAQCTLQRDHGTYKRAQLAPERTVHRGADVMQLDRLADGIDDHALHGRDAAFDRQCRPELQYDRGSIKRTSTIKRPSVR
jgi:hypothetical protein